MTDPKKRFDQLSVQRVGDTLILEWDNRELPKSGCLTWSMIVFWMIWAPATCLMTCAFFMREEGRLFLGFWLIFGYVGTLGIPIAWTFRGTLENVETGPEFFRHYHVDFKWFFPTNWATKDIETIEYGFQEDESIISLVVRGPMKLDSIAYWATNEFQRELFELIRAHLETLGSNIKCVDLTEEAEAES